MSESLKITSSRDDAVFPFQDDIIFKFSGMTVACETVELHAVRSVLVAVLIIWMNFLCKKRFLPCYLTSTADVSDFEIWQQLMLTPHGSVHVFHFMAKEGRSQLLKRSTFYSFLTQPMRDKKILGILLIFVTLHVPLPTSHSDRVSNAKEDLGLPFYAKPGLYYINSKFHSRG